MVNKWDDVFISEAVTATLYSRMDVHLSRGQNRDATERQTQKDKGMPPFFVPLHCGSGYERIVKRLLMSSSHLAQSFVDKRIT
jgi:hypothetical protein